MSVCARVNPRAGRHLIRMFRKLKHGQMFLNVVCPQHVYRHWHYVYVGLSARPEGRKLLKPLHGAASFLGKEIGKRGMPVSVGWALTPQEEL